MRRFIIYFIVIFFVVNANAQSVNLREVRNDFNKAVKDQELCKKNYEYLSKNASTDTEKGYEAVFRMFMAKHTSNPIKKMSYFKEGKSLLEKQIKNNSSNTELRFLRLCVQYYTPAFLGYKSNINEDKNFLLNNLYKLQDKDVKDVLFKYLEGTKIYTKEELLLLARDK